MSATLWTFLEEAALRAPRRVAFTEPAESGERAATFAELRELSLRIASVLRAGGLRAGERAAIVCRNGIDFVAAYLAVVRLGAAAVPVNFLIQKPEELGYILTHSSSKAVVCQAEFLPALAAARTSARLWSVEELRAAAASAAPLAPGEPAPSPGDVASVIYTSGTTGKPKGVMLTHANLVSNCDAAVDAFRLDGRAVFLCLLPMFHTFAWTVCVLIPLRLAAKVVSVPSVVPAAPWLKRMGRHGVTVFAAVPQIYAVLAREAVGLKGLFMRFWAFRRTRLCISGAAPLAAATREAFRRALGVPILEGYGLTETSPVATINRPGADKPGTVGPALPGVEVRIVGEDGKPLAPGGEGEILVRGPNVMKGYLDDPEATRETIDPEGWLRTGDIGALDSGGWLQIRDRKKDMIIVKGLKVFSAQVEEVLMTHPGVAEAAVIGLPDETGDETIKAFVVPKEGASIEKADLLRLCRERLDAYKRPRDVEIVRALPKNALQKVLKRELRRQELEKRG